MARKMTFSISGKDYVTEPAKIDRKKLYGWSEIHAYDDNGNECLLVSTDASGTIIIPRGGIALGAVSKDGKWAERSSLQTVTLDGSEAVMTPSSYSQATVLAKKASAEDLLDCSITALYHLPDSDPELIAAIGSDIYAFDYCYRDSYEPSPGFLLVTETSGNPELFLLIGAANQFEYIGLEELAVADDEEDSGDEDDDLDDIDFGML